MCISFRLLISLPSFGALAFIRFRSGSLKVTDKCYDCKPTRIFLPYSQPSHSYYHISFVIFMPPTTNILHESFTILHQPHFHIKTFILAYWLLLRIGCFITFTFSQLKFDFIDSICCYPKYYMVSGVFSLHIS